MNPLSVAKRLFLMFIAADLGWHCRILSFNFILIISRLNDLNESTLRKSRSSPETKIFLIF